MVDQAETLETIELIVAFPENYPDSRVYAEHEAEMSDRADQDWAAEMYIATGRMPTLEQAAEPLAAHPALV